MTDHPDPLDELASAHLDGATTPDEEARIAADPALLARVAELRAVRDAVRASSEPVDVARREAAIAAALAAYHDDAPPRVTSLADVAARRHHPSRTALRLVGAAAVLALLALLVPLLGRVGDGGDDAAESAADQAAEDGDELEETAGDAIGDAPEYSGDDGGSEAAGGADVTTSTAASRPIDLGSFDDLDSLAASLSDPREGAPSSPLNPEATGGGCAEARADAFSAGTTMVATASLAGEAVEVLVVTGDDGTASMTVLRADTCTVLGTRRL